MDSTCLPPVLESARADARERALSYAGDVSPQVAWQLVQADAAALVDVRSAEEFKWVGHVPGSLHVPWASGLALARNPDFVGALQADLAGRGGNGAVALLLCRSGVRSVLAAQAAAQAGFTRVFNVLEGFEGVPDERQQRGHVNGWRFRGLPWVQD